MTAKAGFSLLMGIAFLATPLAVAEQLTGCLTEKGALTKVAPGDVPQSPCNTSKGEIQVTLDEPQPPVNRVSTCPCNYKTFNTKEVWRLWDHPVCQQTAEDFGDTKIYSLGIENNRSTEPFDDPSGSVTLYYDNRRPLPGEPPIADAFCRITWYDFDQESRRLASEQEFFDCIADLQELWVSEGDGSTCEIQVPDEILAIFFPE